MTFDKQKSSKKNANSDNKYGSRGVDKKSTVKRVLKKIQLKRAYEVKKT